MGKFIIKRINNKRPQIKSNNTSAASTTIKKNVEFDTTKVESDVVEVKPSVVEVKPKVIEKAETVSVVENKKETNNKQVMTTSEKINMVQSALNAQEPAMRVKRVKRDKGLIERTESSKTILTEDNKELLND